MSPGLILPVHSVPEMQVGQSGPPTANDRTGGDRVFTKLRAIPAQFSRENYLACALLIATCTRKMELLAAPWSEV